MGLAFVYLHPEGRLKDMNASVARCSWVNRQKIEVFVVHHAEDVTVTANENIRLVLH